MGLIDIVNGFFDSFRDFASSSTEFKCSQCIKCRQCIKNLSNGSQIRVFSCPAVYDGLPDNEYINSLLPSVSNGFTTEYINAYNQNRDAIFNYLYDNPTLYIDSALPLYNRDGLPIGTLNELRYTYKAMECPYFRPFLDTSNIINDNDTLTNYIAPDLHDFYSLSKEDKMIVSQRYDW